MLQLANDAGVRDNLVEAFKVDDLSVLDILGSDVHILVFVHDKSDLFVDGGQIIELCLRLDDIEYVHLVISVDIIEHECNPIEILLPLFLLLKLLVEITG